MRRSGVALLAVAVTVLALAVAVTSRAPQARALSGSQFHAGNIISDAQFYDSTTLTAAGVQTFLNGKYSGCAAGYVCLRDYTTRTVDEPAEAGLCRAYDGKPSETAAQIIAKVAIACGVNPQALLVLLQKESSLVTTTTPNYRTSAGYGCPDSTGCSSKYFGFFNQVYLAARQFKLYRLHPSNYNYVAGRSNYILYNPNTQCGGSKVYIENQATAGLYDYTPYQPNAAALANLTGTGDRCSAYGNRNFWYFFNTWFATPAPPHSAGGLVLTKPDGTLWYYADNADLAAPYTDGVRIGIGGWQRLTHLTAGDVDGDGRADLVGTRADGSLWRYRNDGSALPYPSRTKIGASGWTVFNRILLGDVDGDGRADLVATKTNGTLWLYRNTGDANRPFKPRARIATSGWADLRQLALADVDGDGRADLVSVHADGSLWLSRNTGSGTDPFPNAVKIGAGGWSRFDKFTLADVDSDGLADIVASRRDGTLWLYRNTPGQGQPYHDRTEIGRSGWQAFDRMLATDVPVPHRPVATDLVATQPAGSLWRFADHSAVRPYDSGAAIGHGWQAFVRLAAGDVTGDGRADIVAVKPDGSLWLYRNTGSASRPYTARDSARIGKSGWQRLTTLVAADVNGDGRADLVATRSDGTLWVYRNSGDAADPFPHRALIGRSGWGQFDRIVAGDVDGDGRSDLVATRPDGSLVRYVNTGSRTRPYRPQQATGLTGWQAYAALAAGDVDGDGRADLVATRPDGTLWLDRDGGTDRFPKPVRVGASGWQAFDTLLATDVDGDGRADLIARTPAGSMRLYRAAAQTADPYPAAAQVGASGWQAYPQLTRADVDGDGLGDLVAADAGGALWLYRNTGNTTRPYPSSPRKIGRSGWQNYASVVAADVDGSGRADLVAAKPDGSLWLYRNTGDASRPYTSAKTQIGSGFDAYDRYLAADVTGDGLPDLVAAKPDGTLWLYRNVHDPGDPYPDAVRIGTGWQAYDAIAAVDVDRDGRTDLVAAKPDGSLWLYRNSGRATNPFPAPVRIAASGWGAYDRLL